MGKILKIKLLVLTFFISLFLTFGFATPAYAAENDNNVGLFQRIVNFFFPNSNQQNQEQSYTSDPQLTNSIEDQLNILGISADSVEALNQRLAQLEELTAILQENSLKASTILPGATYADLIGTTFIDTFGNIYPNSGNPSIGTSDKKFGALYVNGFSVNGGETTSGNTFTASNRANLNGDIHFGGKMVSSIEPSETNKHSLGSTTNRFEKGFITSLTGERVETDTLVINKLTDFNTHLSPRIDNTYDVGSILSRWRTGYFGTSVVVGNTVTVTTNTITGSGTLTINSTGTNALNLDSTTTGDVNLGTGNNSKTVNIGTGTAGNTINIGNNNTTADTIQIGSALDSTTIVGANWSVTPLGAASFSSTGTFGSTLTAQNGLTLTTGALSLTATSGSFNLSGLGASSINTGTNNLLITSNNFNTTATGINGTNIGATTAGTADFTSLSASGDTSLNANVVVGDATTDRLTVNSEILGANPFVFQGATDDDFTTTFAITDPTANRMITFPNNSGTVLLTGDALFTLAATSGTNSTISQGGTATLTAGTDITTTGDGAGAVTIANTSTLSSVTGRGATTTTLVNFDGGIAVDTSNFTVDGTTGAVTSASTFNGATLSGGSLSGGIFSGGSVSGGSLTGGTYTGTGLTVTGNYTATINNGGTFNISDGTQNIFTITDAGTKGSLSNIEDITAAGNLTVDEDITLGTAITDLLTINAALQGSTPLVFEGATIDGAETFIAIIDPTTDRTINIPNASGTFAVSASSPISLSAAGDISCTTCVTLDGTQTLTNKTIAAGSNTISGLSVSNFASANISNWTNDAGYLTAEADTLDSVIGRGATTATTVALNGGLTSSSITPITLSHATPVITIGTAGTNATLIINDGEATPNSLFAIVDEGTTGTLLVNAITTNSITGFTLTGNITGSGSPTLSGLGAITSDGNFTLSGNASNIDFTGTGVSQITTAAGQDLVLMPGQFLGIGTTTPGHLIELNGGAYSDGANWVNASDRNLKTNFAEINADEVLGKIVSLPITEWNYKTNDGSVRHIGPMAQDFYAAFKLGGSDTSISTIDPSGVALVGIQALNKNLLSTTYKVDEIGVNVNNIDEQVKAANSVFDNFNKETENLKNENATIKEQLALVIDRLGKLETFTASNSAQVASQSAQVAQEVTPIPVFESSASAQLVFGNSIKADEATISGKLISFGETYLARTLFAGDIIQDGTFSITGGNTINALPILYLQTNSLAQGIDLFNGKITADKDGNIKAAGEIAGKQIALSNESAGTGVIKAGETKVIISAGLVQDNSLIFVTPTSATDKVIYIGSKQAGKEFSVETKSAADADITFNWWIVKSN